MYTFEVTLTYSSAYQQSQCFKSNEIVLVYSYFEFYNKKVKTKKYEKINVQLMNQTKICHMFWKKKEL